MKLFNLVIVFSAILTSCHDTNTGNEYNETRITNIAKWTTYYMNTGFKGEKIYSEYPFPDTLEIVQCSLWPRIWHDTNSDTIVIGFSIYYKDTLNVYSLSDGFYVIGVKLYKNSAVAPVFSVGRADIENFPDSIKYLMRKQEERFIDYLIHFPIPDSIDPWLRSEMRRRRIKNIYE